MNKTLLHSHNQNRKTSGETLVETLCAALLFTFVTLFLVQSATGAADIQANTKQKAQEIATEKELSATGSGYEGEDAQNSVGKVTIKSVVTNASTGEDQTYIYTGKAKYSGGKYIESYEPLPEDFDLSTQ